MFFNPSATTTSMTRTRPGSEFYLLSLPTQGELEAQSGEATSGTGEHCWNLAARGFFHHKALWVHIFTHSLTVLIEECWASFPFASEFFLLVLKRECPFLALYYSHATWDHSSVASAALAHCGGLCGEGVWNHHVPHTSP